MATRCMGSSKCEKERQEADSTAITAPRDPQAEHPPRSTARRGRRQRAGATCHVIDRQPEVLEYRRGRRRFAEAIDTDHIAFQPDVLVPAIRHAGFDGKSGHSAWQNGLSVCGTLAIECVGGGHRYDAYTDAVPGEHLARAHGERDSGSRGDDYHGGPPISSIGEHVAAAGDVRKRNIAARLEREILPTKQ